MDEGCSRREYLALATAAGSGSLGRTAAYDRDVPDVNGAIYWPGHAYTHYQTWLRYDPAEIERDLGYATRLDLNAVRLIVGYEFWRDAPSAFEAAFGHLLDAADSRGIHVLPVLFESVGGAPSTANLLDTDVRTAHAAQSPGEAVIRREPLWGGPRRFTRWFTEAFGDRIAALEVMNEPCGWAPREAFCRAMLRTARRTDASVPLTVGCKTVEHNRQFTDPRLDVYQFHLNDPADEAEMESAMARGERIAERDGRPVWLTEWQRTTVEPPLLKYPNYASLAPTVRAGPIAGDFFWQLMLKPAYVEVSRDIGRVEGVFHGDGAVYSAADAEAISGGEFREERPRLPPRWLDPGAR